MQERTVVLLKGVILNYKGLIYQQVSTFRILMQITLLLFFLIVVLTDKIHDVSISVVNKSNGKSGERGVQSNVSNLALIVTLLCVSLY